MLDRKEMMVEAAKEGGRTYRRGAAPASLSAPRPTTYVTTFFFPRSAGADRQGCHPARSTACMAGATAVGGAGGLDALPSVGVRCCGAGLLRAERGGGVGRGCWGSSG